MPTMDESISGQKAVIVQGIQEDMMAGFLEQKMTRAQGDL